MITSRLLFNGLGYLGLTPFLAGAWIAVTGKTLLGLQPIQIFASYSTVILSFLGGVLWGRCLALGEEASVRQRRLLLLSNAVALVAWVAVLGSYDNSYANSYANLPLVVALLMLGYPTTYLAERSLPAPSGSELIYPYMGMRLILTIVVAAAHLVVLFGVD